MPQRILVIHGPNLNLLGKREPEIYGHQTLDDINRSLQAIAEEHGITLDVFQSNHEGDIVDFIGGNMGSADGIVINPAAYTHTSVAIRDALTMTGLPVIEVHLSNVYQREVFRHHSYISPIATGIIAGLGVHSYTLALEGLLRIIRDV